GYKKEEAGIEHVIAGRPDGFRIAERDGRRIIRAGDQMVDQTDFRFAHLTQATERWMIANEVLVFEPAENHETGGQGRCKRRHVTRGKQRRQADLEELANKSIAPNRKHALSGLRWRLPIRHGATAQAGI